MHELSNQPAAESNTHSENRPLDNQIATYLGLFLIALVTVAAYSSVIADFFHGDDYIHLTWLPKAIAQPDLIWRNFYTSWLGGFYAQFYRPLISVFNVVDYIVWRGNGIGFHLTNLFAHLATTLFLFLIVQRLSRAALAVTADTNSIDQKFLQANYFALASAALFALYPAHPEAVSWITGRVDSICAMFTLGSLWCFMEWHDRQHLGKILASLVLFILGLLSKEMAVTLPAVVVTYLLLFSKIGGPQQVEGTPTVNDVRAKIMFALTCLLKAWPYWLVWVAYFVVRHHALGTLVGGYDNAMFSIPDWNAFFVRWGTAMKNFLVPINEAVTYSTGWESEAWRVLLATAIGSSVVVTVISPATLRIGLFALAWMALSLVPVFKALYVHEDLEGSRMVYLASAPLCTFALLGLSRFLYSGKFGKYVSIIASFSLLFVSDLLLVANNRPWYEAGMETQAIERGLKRVYAKDANIERLCYFAGIPNAIDGAYVGCNAFDGMSKVPRMDHDLKNCFGFSPIDRIFPYGYAKGKLPEMLGYTHVYRWNSATKQFDLVSFPAIEKEPERIWKVGRVRPFISAVSWEENGSVFKDIGLWPTGLDCWNADVIQFVINVTRVGAQDKFHIVKLRYKNDLQNNYDEETEEFNSLIPSLGVQKVIFPLRGNANWWLGGQAKRLRLELPPGWQGKIIAVQSLNPDKLIAKLEFAQKRRAHNLGPIVLNNDYRSCPLTFDVSGIDGANSAVVDITFPNMFFESHNSPRPSAVVARQIAQPSVRGQFDIDCKQFSAPGIYEVRVRALDAHGNTVGLSSDHLAVFLPQVLNDAASSKSAE